MSNWKTSSYSGWEGDCVEADGRWVTSSHSGGNGGNCVELSGVWATSSYSDFAGNQCVEVAVAPVVRVRDTKDRSRRGLAVSGRAWVGFIEGQKL